MNVMMDELLTCSICEERYDENDHLPKFLACFHTFCVECMGKIYDNNSKFICPVCRKDTAGFAASDLTTNFYLTDVQRIVDEGGCDGSTRDVQNNASTSRARVVVADAGPSSTTYSRASVNSGAAGPGTSQSGARSKVAARSGPAAVPRRRELSILFPILNRSLCIDE
jgi:hypothetical protein